MNRIASLLLLVSVLWSCRLRGQEAGSVIPFQGQLANQAGQPLANLSSATLVFRLYQTPVGGVAIWEESLPNISVNAGRFSVLLGSRVMLPGHTNFNATLYLGITVDDGSPATTDVEMRPRQALVPVVSAAYARNADKLNGFDWTSIFGINNPTGKIAGTKLADASITGAQISPSTLTSNHVANGAITSNHIASAAIETRHLGNGIVSSSNMAAGAVQTLGLADNAVTFSKLASRGVTLAGVTPVGGVAVSSPVTFSTNAFNVGLVEVPGLSVALVSLGRPVYISLVPGPPPQPFSNPASPVGEVSRIGFENNPDWSGSVGCAFAIYRNGTNIVSLDGVRTELYSGTGAIGRGHVPAGSLHALDFNTGAGTNTYSVKVSSGDPRVKAVLWNVRLVAYEL